MEDYRLTQTGQEVQDILNGAVMPADLAAEKDRAELAEQALQGKIDDEEARAKGEEGTLQDNIDAEETRAKGAEKQNADDIDALEEDVAALLQLIPSAASSENQLADKEFVTDSYDGLMQYVTEQIIANIPEFKGQFTTLAQLQEVADPKDGDIGIVRTKDTDGHDVFTFYQHKEEQWNEFYTLSYHPQRKPASTGLEGDAPYNGMGRIELPMNWVEGWPNDTWLYYPYNDVVYLMYYWNGQMYAVYNAGTQEGLGLDDNLVVKPLDYNIADIQQFVGERYLPFTESSGVWTITKPDDSTITNTELNNTNIYKVNDPTHLGINVLTQAMINRPNTIYVIQYDFVLGEDINVPANCVLEFDGGIIGGAYTLTGNNTGINAGFVKIFNTNITLTGTWRVGEAYPEWFGAKGDGVADDILAIQAAVDNARIQRMGICSVKLLYNHTYKVSAPIRIPSFMRFGGTYTSVNAINDDKKATIVANGTNAINLYGYDYDETTAPSRIFITDLVVEGNNYRDNSGIATVANCPGVSSVSIDGVLLGGFKCGINFSGSSDTTYARIKNTATDPNNPVGIGIYIYFQVGIYGLDIVDCILHTTKIGGVHIKTDGGIVGSINVINTVFENCGYNYDMDYLDSYGSWGLYVDAPGNCEGFLNIRDCYFEANCPERSYGDGTLHNDNPYGFIEATNTNHTGIYISNPNFKNTAEIVMSCKNLNVNVINTHITADYQPISIVNYGILTFKNNSLYNRNTLDGRLGVRQKSIVKVFDETTYRSCENIGIHIERLNFSEMSVDADRLDYLEQAVELVNNEVSGNERNVTTQNAVLYIDCPQLGEKYSYRTKDNEPCYGSHAYIYIDPNASYDGNGSKGDPFRSFGRAINRLRYSYDTIETTFILLNDITIAAEYGYDHNFPSGKTYNIVPDDNNIKTLTFDGRDEFNFYNSNVLLERVGVITTSNSIIMHNGSLTVRGFRSEKAPITIGTNDDLGLCRSFGNVNFVCEYCTFTTNDGTLGTGAINRKDTGKVYTFLVNCENPLDIPVVDDSNA